MKNAFLNLVAELYRALSFYKTALMVFFPVVAFTTGYITVEETTLIVVLALAVLMHEIWIEVSE